jgi:arylamine N-acetyltransferase
MCRIWPSWRCQECLVGPSVAGSSLRMTGVENFKINNLLSVCGGKGVRDLAHFWGTAVKQNPLRPPSDRKLLQQFAQLFRLPAAGTATEMLRSVATAFAQLPYENLTKIIKDDDVGRAEQARRAPDEVIADHAVFGAGGTCFSLTATFLHLVRSLGWQAEPILADRPYGQNTHCALVVWIDHVPHLIDPGYLIVQPVPLAMGSRETRVTTPFNELVLTHHHGGDKLDLSTVQEGDRRHRMTFRTQPVDAGEFLRAWDVSFDWDMMRYPLLTRVSGKKQLYLHGQRFQVRGRGMVEREEISDDELTARIAREFGVRADIVARALFILGHKG